MTKETQIEMKWGRCGGEWFYEGIHLKEKRDNQKVRKEKQFESQSW